MIVIDCLEFQGYTSLLQLQISVSYCCSVLKLDIVPKHQMTSRQKLLTIQEYTNSH